MPFWSRLSASVRLRLLALALLPLAVLMPLLLLLGMTRWTADYDEVLIANVESDLRIAEQYLRKGSKVYLEGQLETRKWQDQSGQDRYTTEVVLRPYRGELTLLDSRGEGGGGGGGYQDDRGGYSGGGGGGPAPASSDLDDEIPF